MSCNWEVVGGNGNGNGSCNAAPPKTHNEPKLGKAPGVPQKAGSVPLRDVWLKSREVSALQRDKRGEPE